MKKRIRRKIIKRFHDVDRMLVLCFIAHGGFEKNRKLVKTFRSVIQYWRRRYPNLYREAFGSDLDIGHFGAGR